MKQQLLTLMFIIILSQIYSQPVINDSDMPQPGDIINYNIAILSGNYDYTQSGNNHIWNFSFLSPANYSADTFITVNSTPLIYTLIFSNATVSLKQIGSYTQSGMTISNIYDFYKNSSSEFSLIGYGAELNGIKIPAKYDNPDILYRFPLNIGNTDSSTSFFDISLPNIGYFSENKTRKNFVDGWGTLILPLDTFQVLRIKSVVFIYDSIYYQSNGMGYNSINTEYKWLAKGHKEPVLEIVKSNNYTTVTYFGNYDNSINDKNKCIPSVFLSPNPAEDKLLMKVLSPGYSDIIFTVFSINGSKIFEQTINNVSGYSLFEKEIILDKSIFKNGIYIVNIRNNDMNYYQKLIIKK